MNYSYFYGKIVYSNDIKAFINPGLGAMNLLFYLQNHRHFSRDHLYFFIMYAIHIAELLETPA